MRYRFSVLMNNGTSISLSRASGPSVMISVLPNGFFFDPWSKEGHSALLPTPKIALGSSALLGFLGF